MSYQIHTKVARGKLAPRREPFWSSPIHEGLCVGYRKMPTEGKPAVAGSETWLARAPKEGGGRGSSAYGTAPLGAVVDAFEWVQACEAARKWYKNRDAGIVDDDIAVTGACKQYVEDRRREKGEDCAHDAEMRFKRCVYGTPFGDTAVKRHRSPAYKAWLDGLSRGSKKRTWTTLKAALNLAVKNRLVSADLAREWKDVKAKDSGKRRELFLDLGQRRALLAAAPHQALRDLMEGVMLTGARAGELVNATRGQFDGRTKSMTFVGKTGRRDVPLSPVALKLFERLAKSKLPTAPLFTRWDGQKWQHSDWDELVREAADKAKLPKGTCLYTLRHSFITEAVTNGLSTLDVARLCGTSVKMIDEYYGHLVHDAARERLALVQMV